MNLTVISLFIAAAQPLLQSYFTTLMRKKLEQSAKLAVFTCIHSIKGRRRYKSILLKDGNFASALKEKIESLNQTNSVSINSVTGTMVLQYDCDETVIDEIINKINEQTQKVNESKLEKVQSRGAFSAKLAHGAIATSSAISSGQSAAHLNQYAKRTRIGSALNSYTTSANNFVKSTLNNTVDLSIVVGAACFAWGVYKIFVQKQSPNGPQLLWWGYKILEGGAK